MPCVSKFALRTVTAGARDIPAGCEHPRQLTARCTAPRAWRIASCGSTPRDKLARCASPTSCENPLHPGHFSGVSSARSGRAVAHDCLGSAHLVHFVAVAALGARCDLHRWSDSVVGLFSFVTLRVAAWASDKAIAPVTMFMHPLPWLPLLGAHALASRTPQSAAAAACGGCGLINRMFSIP
jgi:hypothetical protein